MLKKSLRVLPILATLCLTGCSASVDPAQLPRAEDSLRSIGKRLGAKLAPDRLEAIGSDETHLLKLLTVKERDSLARGYLRFKVDRPVTVSIAFADQRPPFWLKELGFIKSNLRLKRISDHFQIWTKSYPAGTIGLGVNSLDRSPQGHFVVFVQSEQPNPNLQLIDNDHANILKSNYGDLAPYSDDAQAFETLPSQIADAIVLQPRRDARHNLALVTSKVWKTRVPSTPRPDQVVVGFGNDPARSLTWTWRTDPSITTSELVIATDDNTTQQIVKGDYVPIDSFGLMNDPVIHRHRVTADNLTPNTTYRYAIRDSANNTTTKWQKVRTAPESGSTRDYSFLAMGDPQCGLEEWGVLLHKAHERHPDAGFLVIAGDLVDRGNERSNWDHFFMRASGVFENLPMMPCVGNHEYLDRGPIQFAKSFLLPANGPKNISHNLTYSFEYSDTFVAVLDSNPAVYSSDKAKQLSDWLDEQLSKTKAKWRIVVFHHPIYPSHPSRATPNLAAAWIPIFDKHKVDLVLNGHDHAYLRTYPMRGDEPVAAAENGTVYVVSVSGQKFVPIADRPYAAHAFANVATYEVINVSPIKGTLTYRVFDVDGIEHDSFTLKKQLKLTNEAQLNDNNVNRSVFESENRQ